MPLLGRLKSASSGQRPSKNSPPTQNAQAQAQNPAPAPAQTRPVQQSQVCESPLFGMRSQLPLWSGLQQQQQQQHQQQQQPEQQKQPNCDELSSVPQQMSKQQIHYAFTMMDTNKDGLIDLHDLSQMLANLGLPIDKAILSYIMSSVSKRGEQNSDNKMIKCRQQINTSGENRNKKDNDDVNSYQVKRKQLAESQQAVCTQPNCSYPFKQRQQTSCCCCCRQDEEKPQRSRKSTGDDVCKPSGCQQQATRIWRAATNEQSKRMLKQQVAPSTECVKCQLIVKWTRAQAELARKAKLKANSNGDKLEHENVEEEEEEDEEEVDKWSVWTDDEEEASTTANEVNHPDSAQTNLTNQNYSRILSFRRRRLALKLAPLGLRKRRPAPMPPAGARWSRKTARGVDSASSDSGHTSGPETSYACQADAESVSNGLAMRQAVSETKQQQQHKALKRPDKSPAPAPPPQRDPTSRAQEKPNLLTESELFSMEHFLRSHKSAVYVCGCMANLYLTSTKLVNNGRYSCPTADNWQLNKTGVPVLTFDSGLAKNRQRRKLTINLAERGTGFVLWSDIIDHLSNYRAYSARLHGKLNTSESKVEMNEDSSFDTFHVMYLSSNHRLMVGFSFDDATCARLFLKQIELITSDPANISLTGPKLAPNSKRCSLAATTTSLLLSPCVSRPENHSPLDDATAGDTRPSRNDARRVLRCLREKSLSTPAATPPTPTSTTNAARSTTDHNSWSTLKRAIRLRRFGRNQVASSSEKQLAAFRAKCSSETNSAEEQLLAACQPRPLAVLAAAGREYRSGKKLPRKCDISAPCLFQHVARVELNALEGLYSGSLVDGPTRQGLLAAASSQRTEDQLPPPPPPPPPHVDDPRTEISHTHAHAPAHHQSVGSSCYSSGSISPASSDCGRRQSRPLPPTRRTSVGKEGVASVEPAQAGAGGQRIQAIIRELQAQTSSELVDVKRRLMADIANSRLNSARVSHL